MSSGGFPGAGDLYTSLAGTGAGFGKRTLTEMERQQLQQALLLTRSVKHKPADLYNHHQQHHLPYYNASPISPLGNHPLSPADNIDYSSCSGQPVPSRSCSSSTTSASGMHSSGAFHHPPPSLNGMSPLSFIKQQQQQQQQLMLLRQQQQQNQLLQQRKAAVFLHGNNSGHGIQLAAMGGGQQQGFSTYYPSNAATTQHRLAASVHPPQPPAGGTTEVRNRLLELEKQLLDDDDGDGSGAPTTTAAPPACVDSQALVNTSEWSDTIHGAGLMMSATSSCSTPLPPPQHPQPNQPQHQHQHQQPPRTPTATTSAASSCCSSSSPPTTSNSFSAASAKQLLTESASAIAEGNAKSAIATLAALRKSMAAADNNNSNNNNPRPSEPEHRLNEFMSAALLSRISNSDASSCSSSEQLSNGEHLAASQLLYEQSPLFKLGFQAANLAVLDATRGAAVIHILDFDVGHGGQLLPLLSFLAERPAAARPALVKITAVSDPAANPYTTNVGYSPMVRSAGERLIKAGQKAGIAIRFNTVTTRTSGEAAAPTSSSSSSTDQRQAVPTLSRHAIGCDPDESLVVRLAFNLSRIPDESVTPSNPRDHLLRRIKSMNPAIVALAEQELSGNTAPFLPRFADAHAHYAALFESLQHQQDGAAPEILRRAEECLGRKAANTVAREGSGRVERCEVFGKWRARMSMAGFRLVPLTTGALDSLRAKASSLAAGGGTAGGGSGGVAVKEENGGVGFAWNGRTITVTSAWR